MKTSIIVVNWNTPQWLTACVDAVRRHTDEPYELILVDNGSEDPSPDVARELGEGPSTRTLLLPENTGYAGGNNRGLELATGEWLCLLNSDALVTRGWLGRLHRCARRTGADMVGPCTNVAKGKQRRKPWFGRIPPPWPFRRTREVTFLSFFCVLLHRRVLETVGPLDEGFGLGTFEDVDYGRRAVDAGFRLVIDGRTWVWHEGHATFEANALDEREVRRANEGVYREKWGG